MSVHFNKNSSHGRIVRLRKKQRCNSSSTTLFPLKLTVSRNRVRERYFNMYNLTNVYWSSRTIALTYVLFIHPSGWNFFLKLYSRNYLSSRDWYLRHRGNTCGYINENILSLPWFLWLGKNTSVVLLDQPALYASETLQHARVYENFRQLTSDTLNILSDINLHTFLFKRSPILYLENLQTSSA